MRVMILHTPADSAEPGLLLHLQEILRCGSIEVETVVLGEAGLPLPYYSAGGHTAHDEEYRDELRGRFATFAPDVIVLSDHLNGSKLVARDLAAQMHVGVVALKESVFPGRVFFAPDRQNAVPRESDEESLPLEGYQKFRLERALDRAFGDCGGKRPAVAVRQRGRRTGLAIIDHSMQREASEAQRRMWALIGEAKKRGDRIIVCERWRDVCGDRADCGRYVLMMEGRMVRRLPCDGGGLRGLIDESDWCVTNGSLHALEALWHGKPVVAAERCVFSGRGLTFDMAAEADCAAAMEYTAQGGAAGGARGETLQKFLYRFLFEDLLAVDAAQGRFDAVSERRVIDALFRALPLERGARVLSGDV